MPSRLPASPTRSSPGSQASFPPSRCSARRSFSRVAPRSSVARAPSARAGTRAPRSRVVVPGNPSAPVPEAVRRGEASMRTMIGASRAAEVGEMLPLLVRHDVQVLPRGRTRAEVRGGSLERAGARRCGACRVRTHAGRVGDHGDELHAAATPGHARMVALLGGVVHRTLCLSALRALRERTGGRPRTAATDGSSCWSSARDLDALPMHDAQSARGAARRRRVASAR